MKRTSFLLSIIALAAILISASCNNNSKVIEEPAKIENTLKSVSYFQDTVGYDAKELWAAFNVFNEAIAEYGYPDAGYELWVINEEDTDIRFMVQGSWPDLETYQKIHDSEPYKNASEKTGGLWDGLISLEYHRFNKVN